MKQKEILKMKKMMLFVFGLLMGVMITTTVERKPVDVEALETVSMEAESHEGIVSLNSTTKEPTITMNLTEESVEALIERFAISANPTKSFYQTDVNDVLKAAYLTKKDLEEVAGDLSVDQKDSNPSMEIEGSNEPTSTPSKGDGKKPVVETTEEVVKPENVVMDKPIVEQSTVNQTMLDQTVVEESTSDSEKVLLPGGGFDSIEEIKEPLGSKGEASTNDEVMCNQVKPQLVQNPQYTHSTNDLNIWIEKVETGSQRYFWVEIDNNSSVSPIKRALANGLETVPTMAARQNAIIAINASGHYGETGKVMGTTLANGSYAENNWTNASPMVIGQDNKSAWTANRLAVTDIIDQGGATTLTFGPTLVDKGQVLSINASGIGSPTGRHPRTVIGRTNEGRWFFLIVDGRTPGAEGMTLYEVQNLLSNKGISYAYNLDGGGSTTLYFKGDVLNQPSDGSPRRVSDMVYFN